MSGRQFFVEENILPLCWVTMKRCEQKAIWVLILSSVGPYGHGLKLSVLIKIGFVDVFKRQIVFHKERILPFFQSDDQNQLSFQSLLSFHWSKLLFCFVLFYQFRDFSLHSVIFFVLGLQFSSFRSHLMLISSCPSWWIKGWS